MQKFIAKESGSKLPALLTEDQFKDIGTLMKVRTRDFLTNIDKLKDNCYDQKDKCGNKFETLIKAKMEIEKFKVQSLQIKDTKDEDWELDDELAKVTKLPIKNEELK